MEALVRLGTYLLSWITNKWVIIFYILPAVYIIWESVRSLNKLKPTNKAELERDQKYIAFKRNDLDRVTSTVSILKSIV